MQNKFQGFTLIEILIGLTLFGFILSAIYSGLFITTRTWEASADQIKHNDDIRLISSFIRKTISNAIPILYISDDNPQIIFEGHQSKLYFISTLPSHRGGAGLYGISIHLDDENHQNSLSMKYEPLIPGFKPFELPNAAESYTLIQDITSLKIDYFGKLDPEDIPDWHPDWVLMTNLPELVRISVHQGDTNIQWPEIIVQIPSHIEYGQPQMLLSEKMP